MFVKVVVKKEEEEEFMLIILLVDSPSGSLASSIFDPHSALVGASGGVYALIGGYFMNAVVVSLSHHLKWKFSM